MPQLKNLRKNIVVFIILISFQSVCAQITLSHNVGNTPIATDMTSCEYAQSWARKFNLSDFGISSTDKFIINSGQVAIYNSLGGGSIQFNIYKVDSNFPNSYSITDLIGSSQEVNLPVIGETPELINVNFDNPITIPDGVKQILVEVRKFYDISEGANSIAYIAGTENDTDISWYWGCFNVFSHTQTTSLDPPVNNANFFINITGEKQSINDLGLQTKLTYNPCDEAVFVNQYSCSGGGLKFARKFTVNEFGISNNEEFIIDRGQVAFSSVGVTDVRIQFNIYKVDDSFPSSYSENDLIGSSQIINVPYFGSGNGVDPKIFDVFFGEPIIIPSDVDEILVEVYNLPSAGHSGLVFIAGGVQNNGDSWLRSEAGGCPPLREYIKVDDPDVNYFINVSGRTNHITDNFEMNISNICSEFLKEFNIEKSSNITSVLWNFGDPNSGVNNTSTDISPFHDFSQDGTYTITASINTIDGNIVTLTETIEVTEPPNAYGIDNIFACEDDFNSGFSSSFDVSMVELQILRDQTDKIITFIDGNGNEYNSLPNPFTNNVKDRETIIVRVAHEDNPCCYSETTFDLIVTPLPKIPSITDIISCGNGADGFANFDLSHVESLILNNQIGMNASFFNESGVQLPKPLPNPYINSIANRETIRVRLTNDTTGCFNETSFNLIVSPLPIANPLNTLFACDDNNDGISEYFDTSNIESLVLNGQSSTVVSYFNQDGNQLPSPLPNPYTNSNPFNESIIVRVTNTNSDCYAETTLELQAVSQPIINKPNDLYSCDLGDGYAEFNMSSIEQQIIGNQSGLSISYYDSNNDLLPNPLPTIFKNTEPFFQTINVRVEDVTNPICFSETSFNLIVNSLPEVDLDEEYFICNLEPSITLSISSEFDSYEWKFEDDSIISLNHITEIESAGSYELIVKKEENGIICEEVFSFRLIRSVLPKITQINHGELGDNFIEIIASGDGDFEYSIDGVIYQDSNYFPNVQGGVHTVYVRDKQGCGLDSKEVVIIDYPKFFTPNNDGYNDYWQIKGIDQFPRSQVIIFDRYGNMLAQLSSNDIGWDGFHNGELMNTNDYWFKASLSNGISFSGYFTLKR